MLPPLPRARPSRMVLPTDAATLGYVAGIIDGEGTIAWMTATKSWWVAVVMTDESVIQWLSGFGGTFRTVSRPKDRPHWKTQYAWRVMAQNDVKALLEAVMPHLRVKKARAVEALSVINEKQNSTKRGR